MQQFSDDFIDQWYHIIDEVQKTEIPLECIKKVIIKFDRRKRKTINIFNLRKQGLDWDEIETVISRQLSAIDGEIDDVEFIVDAQTVAEIVQPKTNQLLRNL